MLEKYAINILITALLGCIPLGIFLAFYYDDPNWLWLCGTLIVFLS